MKILIVSHNCFSSTQSMGKTLTSLFSEFGKEEVMQLFFYPSLPAVDICENYFRITDFDVIHSIIKRKKCGRRLEKSEIDVNNCLFVDNKMEERYSRINRNNMLLHRLRDLLWKIGGWKTEDLKQWLNQNKPDIVFYALGDATFSQNIARWVAEYLGVPLVTYICDEFYYYYKDNPKICLKIASLLLINSIKKTIIKSNRIFVICDELGYLYEKTFKVPWTTIMTGSLFERSELMYTRDCNSISYIGNMTLNRWCSIAEIALMIKKINEEAGTNYLFTYYGKETEKLSSIKSVNYGGFLSIEQVKNTMYNSCLLIHVESFDEVLQPRLKYSISTKIADSMASGVPVFAYGPSNIASIHHLKKNDCAFVCCSKDELYHDLFCALKDTKKRNEIIVNQIKVAKEYHDKKSNSNKLYTTISIILDEWASK